MSELRYRSDAAEDAFSRLAVGECVARPMTDGAGTFIALWFAYQRATDGERDISWIPVAVDVHANEPRLTWGLAHLAPGRWQVSPSILVSTRRHINASVSERVELWHETPVLVDVPEPAPWEVA